MDNKQTDTVELTLRTTTDTLDMRELKDSGMYIDLTHDAREYKRRILELNGITE